MSTIEPTTIWFPPSATPTLLSAVPIPTPIEINHTPEYGELIFHDTFENASNWMLGHLGAGTVALGKDEITLAINRPNGYLFSLRQGTQLTNFYAEITANPTICRNGDAYGLLLRVSPQQDFYRFTLTCEGQIRLDKFYQGSASSPQPLTFSGSVPRGAPSVSRLGVFARDKELRFYVNGELQFIVSDPTLSMGGLGVFARADGEDIMTVNFSDLEVYKVE